MFSCISIRIFVNTKSLKNANKLPNRTDNQYNFTNYWRQTQTSTSIKPVLDAIFYLLKTDSQWRMLPNDFPKWELVYYYFQRWSHDGTIEEIHEVLRKRLRKKRGREESPGVGIIDSQSVKVTKISGACYEIDGGKKIKRRKRHVVTDTQGVLLGVKVHADKEHDSFQTPTQAVGS